MSLTLFLLLINIGLIILFTTLLYLKRIRNVVYFALTAVLIIFDFATLSLDKIYFLHLEQEKDFLNRIAIYDEGITKQIDLYRRFSKIQIELTLAAITLPNKNETEENIQQKITWRNAMQESLEQLGFEEELIHRVKTQINQSVHRYLMERLNKISLERMGHRSYGDFVRSRPRNKWTDNLFVDELEKFAKKESLMSENLKKAIQRVRVFDQTGMLL